MQRGEVSIEYKGAPLKGVCHILSDFNSVVEILRNGQFNLNSIHVVLDMLKDIQGECTLFDRELHDIPWLASALKDIALLPEACNLSTKVANLLCQLILAVFETVAFVGERNKIVLSIARNHEEHCSHDK